MDGWMDGRHTYLDDHLVGVQFETKAHLGHCTVCIKHLIQRFCATSQSLPASNSLIYSDERLNNG